MFLDNDDNESAVNVLVFMALVIHSCRESVAFIKEAKKRKLKQNKTKQKHEIENGHKQILIDCESMSLLAV